MGTKAVLFDLFETLITEYADGRRISGRRYDYLGLLGLSQEEFKLEWRSRVERRMRGELASFPDVIRDICRCRGLDADEQSVQSLYQARIQEKRIPFEAVRPDILEMLENLRTHGWKLGLISNCSEEEVRGWEDSPLAGYFDDVIFSYEVQCCKPDPAIYELACRRLQILPEDCVFVGDGGSGELDGAHQAGMKVIHAVWFNPYVESRYAQLSAPMQLAGALPVR
ncbi:HAD family hydrolase [Paenibacillus sp. Y412MC10]|uniref:HAD family hydrolase n=1 Tax=Geobacillus sp. (strain Y412MC10) TaxID=481743 RepID=UPI0011A47595|nr:HAD-IA family hydrolase [Paenibacillus sp. Y412MC10]